MSTSTITYSDFRPLAWSLMTAPGRYGLAQAATNGCVTLARRFVR